MPIKKVIKKVPEKKATKKVVAKKVVVKKSVKAPVAKAVVKKTPVKKSASKTTVKKAMKKTLSVASEQTSFWVSDGQILNTLQALHNALNEMSDEVYKYHMNKERKDFANWVGAVLCDEKCAKELEKATTPSNAKTVVARHLKFYSI